MKHSKNRGIIRILPLCAAAVLAFGSPRPASAERNVHGHIAGDARVKQPGCAVAAAHVSLALENRDMEDLRLAESYRAHMRETGGDERVIRALYRASLKTGVEFRLLLLKAIMESDLGQHTVAAESSARGVFQYIEPTWLILMHRYGEEIGYAAYARAVKLSRRTGAPFLEGPDRYLRSEILALRHDPYVSALIKARQIREETDLIRAYKKGGQVTATDHYIAHMLGLALAKDLYRLVNNGSAAPVARMDKAQMREAAMLNRAFFFQGNRPLPAAEVYRRFEQRVGREYVRMNRVAGLHRHGLQQASLAPAGDEDCGKYPGLLN